MNRREWIAISGSGMLSSCGAFPVGGGAASWSREQLARADQVARTNGARGWAAWESGRLQKSWQTYESSGILSITKAIACLVCAKAADEGWLSAEERVAETITEWQPDPGKSKVTVVMLLQQVSGLESGAKALYRGTLANKGKVAIALPQIDPPGVVFRYGPSHWEVLAELLARKCEARGDTLEGLINRAAMRPIGISSRDWRSDQAGRFYLSTGAELNITDLGRLGRVIGRLLNGRNSAGISARSFEKMSKTSTANPMFGGGLWRNRGVRSGRVVEIEQVLDPTRSSAFWQGACLAKNHTASLVMMVGSSGKRVYIWPESDRVVARLGYRSSWGDRPLLDVL